MTSLNDVSIVSWYPNADRHLCGYCKNEKGNISHGMWAESLTVEDYQNLIDRGWRRSGNYCYKPMMDQICCPMYTIRCDGLNFQLSKSQKKVIKKFNKHLKDGILNKSNVQSETETETSDGVSDMVFREAPTRLVNSEQLNEAVNCINPKEIADIQQQSSNATNSGSPQAVKRHENSSTKSGLGADPNKPLCKKAKILRLERKQEKLQKHGKSTPRTPVKNEQKSLEELLNEVSQDAKHSFKLELINTSRRGEDWEKVKNTEFALFKKYQTIIHNDPPAKSSMEGFMRFLVKSPLEITLERLHEKHKHFNQTLQLFQKYQMAIHNESPKDCDKVQYSIFLIESPLLYEAPSNDSEVGFGSFHQLYWLDDKLIAVGVIDILPKCVSAVYFFYDPDYRSLTLGTYGSLREVEFVRSLHQKVPSISYYYMGYYIHSCQKMRYKGKLVPSFLLCPETYHWVPIEKCLGKLENSRYARLSEENCEDENMCSSQDVDNIRIFWSRKIFPFKLYKTRFGQEPEYSLAAKLIGKRCCASLIFIAHH